jgi:predicted mannosyl-3-phosphoglycerate phosphatase (HAD superfamily)
MLIFSDVDGTLLEDDGTCRLPAGRLARAARQHRVVLASSRDVGELHAVHELLGWSGEVIAEDGAVIATADGTELLGTARGGLLEVLHATLPDHITAPLLASEPARARQRLGSVLLPRQMVDAEMRAKLEAAGLQAMPGGRWTTLTQGSTKGSAARAMAVRWGVTRWAAIGNAPNDATLLSASWRSFVIRNPDGHDPALARIAGATLLTVPGPEGWLEMLDLLDQPTGNPPGKEHHDADAALDDQHPHDPGT